MQKGHFGSDGEPDFTPPVEPTPFRPGTRDKIKVLQLRFEAGEHLYHPSDNQEVDFDAWKLDRDPDRIGLGEVVAD